MIIIIIIIIIMMIIIKIIIKKIIMIIIIIRPFLIAHTAYEKFCVSVFRVTKNHMFSRKQSRIRTFLLRIRVFFSYAVCAIRNMA